ncbi:MAG: glycosyltransferase family 39 protein [Opitutaceae bacterium]|nr:glycosyltransferase family 39 protein [Cytophagales bacterium]
MDLYKPIAQVISDKFFKWFLAIVCVFNIGHNCMLLEHPFTGQNAWRDAQTYGVARNFLEEPGSFLEPKYDIRNSDDGRLPGEFPLQTLYTASFMKLFGITLFNARLANYILGLFSALLLFYVLQRTKGILTALVGIAIYSSNPLAMSQMVAVMPETMVSFLFCLSLFWYYFIKNSYLKWGLVIITITLCTLVKPSGFVIILFFISHHFFYHQFKVNKSSFLLYSGLVIIPVVFLVLWMKYTMQFENPQFGYPITHHYVRTFKDFLHDFDGVVVITALEKTFRHAFNVSGILGLILLGFFAFKKPQILKQESYWNTSIGLWILGSIAFLFYAGIVQNVQLYYATPLIVPAVLLVGKSLSVKGYLRILVMLIILLQTNIKVNTFNENFFNEKKNWDKYRLESTTDKWSTRKDLFIVYPYPFPEFTMLGRLGRRGYNLNTPEAMEREISKFKFICVVDTNRRHEILKYVNGSPIEVIRELEFYKVKE